MKPLHMLALWAINHPVLGPPREVEGGAFRLTLASGAKASIIASWRGGWDHVSVSLVNRTPTWAEMEEVRHKFFHPQETVMQLHVPAWQHVNMHPHCLHLWRPHLQEIPRPPLDLV